MASQLVGPQHPRWTGHHARRCRSWPVCLVYLVNTAAYWFTLDFDHDDYLTRWDFSPVFVTMVPAKFFEESIRSLAKGRVDEASRKYKIDPKDRAKITVPPPILRQIKEVMGEPLEKSKEDGKIVYIYRFQVDSPWIDPDYQDRRFTDVRLYFDPKTDELTRMGGRFIGLKINISLAKG